MALKKIQFEYPSGNTHISLIKLAESYADRLVEPIIFNPPQLVSIWTYPRGANVDAELCVNGEFIGNTIHSNPDNWETLKHLCESKKLKVPPVFYDSNKEGYTPEDFETLNKAFEASKKRPEWSIWAKFSDGSMETNRERINAKSKFVHDVIFPLIRDEGLVAYGGDLIPIQIGKIEALPMLGLANAYFYIEEIAPLLKPNGIEFIVKARDIPTSDVINLEDFYLPSKAADILANELNKPVSVDGLYEYARDGYLKLSIFAEHGLLARKIEQGINFEPANIEQLTKLKAGVYTLMTAFMSSAESNPLNSTCRWGIKGLDDGEYRIFGYVCNDEYWQVSALPNGVIVGIHKSDLWRYIDSIKRGRPADLQEAEVIDEDKTKASNDESKTETVGEVALQLAKHFYQLDMQGERGVRKLKEYSKMVAERLYRDGHRFTLTTSNGGRFNPGNIERTYLRGDKWWRIKDSFLE